jgi:hypothetical protein
MSVSVSSAAPSDAEKAFLERVSTMILSSATTLDLLTQVDKNGPPRTGGWRSILSATNLDKYRYNPADGQGLQIEWKIYAPRKSGHHAIVEWILRNLGGYTDLVDRNCYVNPSTGVYFYNEVGSRLSEKFNYELRNWENHLPDRFTHPRNIIVMRDYLNLMASILASHSQRPRSSKREDIFLFTTELWKKFARFCLEKKPEQKECVIILYNRWLTDKSYRDNIGVEMKIPNVIDDIGFVPPTIAGVSSFPGQDKKYLERFRQFQFLPGEVDVILKDEELRSLNLALFGSGMDTRALLETPAS